MQRDDLFDGCGMLAVAQHDEARQQRRDFDASEAFFGAFGVADNDRKVEGKIRDIWKGVRGIDGKWREDRKDLIDEHVEQVGAVGRVERFGLHELDPGCVEFRNDLCAEHGALARRQLGNARTNLAELLVWIKTVGREPAHLGYDLLHQSGDADLEEFVEVLAENCQVLRALEDRLGLVLGEGEHASVEIEPRQLAIEKALGALGCNALPNLMRYHQFGTGRVGRLGDRHAKRVSTTELRALSDLRARCPTMGGNLRSAWPA